MIKFTDYVSKIAIAVVIGGVALANPAFAQDASDSADASQGMKHEGGMKRVDDRIKELHDTLGVTAGQEHQWRKVTEVMRKNEAIIHRLVIAREEAESASAVDDLKSYEKIAFAHDQGLRRLIPAFQSFYNTLTPDQKDSADDMFGQYEGRRADEQQQGNAATYNGIAPASGDEANGNNQAPNSVDQNEVK